MRTDLRLSRREIRWRRKHEPQLHPRFYRRYRPVTAALPPGPHGFDVSSYQPAGPNFRVNGRSFAIFKATESVSYFDPHFNVNRAAAHAQGCTAVGLYHFARPGSTSPDAQANYFLAHVGRRQPNEFAVLDYEVPPWSESWIVRYVQLLQQAGWQVAFYTYAGMAAANSTSLVRAATPFYWPAGYGSNPPSADRWADVGWTLWQHTDGSVGSVDGPWDCSVASPALGALAQWGNTPPPTPSPIPSPTPTPTPEVDMVCIFQYGDRLYVGVLGAWRKWIATPGVFEMLVRHGTPLNATDGTAIVQRDVFDATPPLGTVNQD